MEDDRRVVLAKGLRIVASCCVVVSFMIGGVARSGIAPGNDGAQPSTADHALFKELQHEFASGPEVTAACLVCHTEAARQVQSSIHWTWNHDGSGDQARLGKRHVINNY